MVALSGLRTLSDLRPRATSKGVASRAFSTAVRLRRFWRATFPQASILDRDPSHVFVVWVELVHRQPAVRHQYFNCHGCELGEPYQPSLARSRRENTILPGCLFYRKTRQPCRCSTGATRPVCAGSMEAKKIPFGCYAERERCQTLKGNSTSAESLAAFAGLESKLSIRIVVALYPSRY